MGTSGPVRGRANPLQSRTGPIWDCPWFTLVSMANESERGGQWKLGLPIPRSNGPGWQAVPWMPSQIPTGPRAGFVRATKGHHGHARTGPAQISVHAWSNPVIGPVRDLTGHSGHSRLNPVGAPAGAAIWEMPRRLIKWCTKYAPQRVQTDSQS